VRWYLAVATIACTSDHHHHHAWLYNKLFMKTNGVNTIFIEWLHLVWLTQLITDPNIFLMIESAIRGGISTVSNQFATANNKYFKSYNSSRPKTSLNLVVTNIIYHSTSHICTCWIWMTLMYQYLCHELRSSKTRILKYLWTFCRLSMISKTSFPFMSQSSVINVSIT